MDLEFVAEECRGERKSKSHDPRMPEACFIGKSVTADAVTWNAVIYRLTGRGLRKRSATCRETKSISDRMWEFGAVV